MDVISGLILKTFNIYVLYSRNGFSFGNILLF